MPGISRPIDSLYSKLCLVLSVGPGPFPVGRTAGSKKSVSKYTCADLVPLKMKWAGSCCWNGCLVQECPAELMGLLLDAGNGDVSRSLWRECRWSSVFLLSTLNPAVASPTAPLDRDIDSEEPPPSSGHLNHKHLSCVATATSTISFVPGTSQSVFWIIWMVGNWRCTQLGYRRSCQCTGSVRSSTLSVAEVEWSPLCRCTANP